jgi:phosphate transport system substrate-binding protein
MPGTATIVSAVTNDVTGIGYGGVAYGRGIREIRIKADSVSIAYAPTLENIESGKYAASRFLYMYVRKGPSGVLKQYIDWILSNEGQEIVREVGYFPIH